MENLCSTINPTINQSAIPNAVHSELDQGFNFTGYEVIVVNDLGFPYSYVEWQHSKNVCTFNTNHRERSVARNIGAYDEAKTHWNVVCWVLYL